MTPESDARHTPFTESLLALATPARIELLKAIRTAKTVTEIKLRLPEGVKGADRVLARQTVKQHLDRLVEIGVVVTREGNRPYGAATEYMVNHQVLYSLAEEFRSLAKIRPADLPPGQTRTALGEAARERLTGPRLILVKGLDEGQVFELKPPPQGPAEWLIGRRRGVSISLDFDLFVSTENSRITWDRKRHFLEDLALSRNGTFLNFRDLRKGTLAPLENGDIIGVGQSALVYRI